jgi:hypothetical protein
MMLKEVEGFSTRRVKPEHGIYDYHVEVNQDGEWKFVGGLNRIPKRSSGACWEGRVIDARPHHVVLVDGLYDTMRLALRNVVLGAEHHGFITKGGE